MDLSSAEHVDACSHSPGGSAALMGGSGLVTQAVFAALQELKQCHLDDAKMYEELTSSLALPSRPSALSAEQRARVSAAVIDNASATRGVVDEVGLLKAAWLEHKWNEVFRRLHVRSGADAAARSRT
jgi:hypothetical protein